MTKLDKAVWFSKYFLTMNFIPGPLTHDMRVNKTQLLLPVVHTVMKLPQKGVNLKNCSRIKSMYYQASF